MLLRSRRIPARPPNEPSTPRSLRPRSPSRRAPPSAKAGGRGAVGGEAGPDSLQDPEEEEVHVLKPLTMQTRSKGKVSKTDSEDFKTPVKGQQLRVRFEMDESSCKNTAVRNICSPLVHFLLPGQDDEKSPQPEQEVFDYSRFNPVLKDEDNCKECDLYTFIKSIPLQSQHSKVRIRDIPVKTRSTPEATLVLDLDETLVQSSLGVIPNAEYTFLARFQDQEYKVYMKVRPYVQDFLENMTKIFEIFVYTSAKKEYAEKILDILDPQKRLIRHRLYQEDCLCIMGHYIKDLTILNRDLAKTVIVGNDPYTFPYHLMNMIPIQRWTGNKDDKALPKLVPYLEKLSDTRDFRRVLKRRTDNFRGLLSED
ncbi:CTL2B protein, partial [Atractosteus spatula]|nr:CTL2B protein [Atractosteus spatula]